MTKTLQFKSNGVGCMVAWFGVCPGCPLGKGLPATLQKRKPDLRFYDAVGPESISITELLERFARYQGKKNFKPVYVDYRYMEEVLNIQR